MDLHGLWSRLTGARPGSTQGAGSDTAGPEAAPHVARGTPAWRRLPPIAPTAHAAPLVAQRSPFEPGLGGAAPTPLALAPLGHERSLEAPAGLVTAVHAPVVARAADPVPVSVRPPGRGRRHDHGGAASAWPTGDEPASAAPVAEAGVPPAVDVPLVRPAPVVARTVDETPLTVAPAPRAPGGFVGRIPTASPVAASSFLPAASGGAATADADLRGAGSGAGAAPADAAPATVPLAPPVVPGLPDVAVARSAGADGSVSLPSLPLVARRNLGQSRRLRIGPALEPTAGPAATGPGPIFQRSVASTPDPMPQFPSDAPLEGGLEPASGAASAGLSVARSIMPHATDHPGHDAESRGATVEADAEVSGEPVPSPGPVALRTVAADRPEVAPLLGTLRPVFDSTSPAVAIARAPAEDEADDAPGGVAAALAALNGPGGLPSPEGPQTVARLPDPWSGPAARRDPDPGSRGGPGGRGGSGRSGGLPGASAGGGRPATGGAGGDPSTASRSASMPYVARTVASPAADRPGDTVTRRSPAPGVVSAGTARLRVGGAVAASVARSIEPAASGSVTTSTFQTVAAGPSVAPSAGDASPPTVLRAVSDPGVPTLGEETATFGMATSPIAGIQRAAEGTSAAASPAGPTGGAAAGAPGAAGPASGPELDALAARLYERIRLRLRRELLADRERAGVLVDLGR